MKVVVAVMVGALVSTGAVAGASGDTEKAPKASYQTIDIILVPFDNKPAHVTISPVYRHAKCVKHDATGPVERSISQETVITVGVTVLGTFATGCHINRSQMYWTVKRGSFTATVTLIKPAGKRVRAECVPKASCTSPRPNAVRITV